MRVFTETQLFVHVQGTQVNLKILLQRLQKPNSNNKNAPKCSTAGIPTSQLSSQLITGAYPLTEENIHILHFSRLKKI